ncbi:MAG: GIY-YIG nuclease family protein [Terriglobia bacterium]
MPKFRYVYVLRSLQDKGLCIGSTRDLKTRLRLHNGGAVRSTNPRRPFELIFYEAYRSEYDAKRREVYLKTTKGRTTLKTMLQSFLRASEGDATHRTVHSSGVHLAAFLDPPLT